MHTKTQTPSTHNVQEHPTVSVSVCLSEWGTKTRQGQCFCSGQSHNKRVSDREADVQGVDAVEVEEKEELKRGSMKNDRHKWGKVVGVRRM